MHPKNPIKVKVKKLAVNAVLPSYSKPGDAGMDLTAIDVYRNRDYKYIEFGTGLSFEIPEGYVGLIFPRSSISKTPHTLANSVGVIDSGYRGEVSFRFRYDDNNEDMEYNVGDRVGQLIVMPFPTVEIEETSELAESERGTGGYGSTGA